MMILSILIIMETKFHINKSNQTIKCMQKINGKWGFVNEENKLIINNEYDMVTEFNKYGFAGIKKGGKWGVVNIKGEIIQEPIYSFKWEIQALLANIIKQKNGNKSIIQKNYLNRNLILQKGL